MEGQEDLYLERRVQRKGLLIEDEARVGDFQMNDHSQ
jgi:hypothetical protein